MFGAMKKMNTQEIIEEMQSGKAVLVDVRRDDEWATGHAKGALHMSVERIMAGEQPVKDTDVKVYLYCASGGRAGVAANALKAQGFATENLGGFSNWRSAGGESD
jgi:rhodanese-related sulfurtransferase